MLAIGRKVAEGEEMMEREKLVRNATESLTALKLLGEEYEDALREVLGRAVGYIYITARAYGDDFCPTLDVGRVHFSQEDAEMDALPDDEIAFLSWTEEGSILHR